MLGDARIAARIPAQDLDRARRFYMEKLGLDPVDERPGWFRDSEGNLLGVGQLLP